MKWSFYLLSVPTRVLWYSGFLLSAKGDLSGVYSCSSAADHWSAVETDWYAGDGVVDYNNFVAFFRITWSNTEVCVVEKEGERK